MPEQPQFHHPEDRIPTGDDAFYYDPDYFHPAADMRPTEDEESFIDSTRELTVAEHASDLLIKVFEGNPRFRKNEDHEMVLVDTDRADWPLDSGDIIELRYDRNLTGTPSQSVKFTVTIKKPVGDDHIRTHEVFTWNLLDEAPGDSIHLKVRGFKPMKENPMRLEPDPATTKAERLARPEELVMLLDIINQVIAKKAKAESNLQDKKLSPEQQRDWEGWFQ